MDEEKKQATLADLQNTLTDIVAQQAQVFSDKQAFEALRPKALLREKLDEEQDNLDLAKHAEYEIKLKELAVDQASPTVMIDGMKKSLAVLPSVERAAKLPDIKDLPAIEEIVDPHLCAEALCTFENICYTQGIPESQYHRALSLISSSFASSINEFCRQTPKPTWTQVKEMYLSIRGFGVGVGVEQARSALIKSKQKHNEALAAYTLRFERLRIVAGVTAADVLVATAYKDGLSKDLLKAIHIFFANDAVQADNRDLVWWIDRAAQAFIKGQSVQGMLDSKPRNDSKSTFSSSTKHQGRGKKTSHKKQQPKSKYCKLCADSGDAKRKRYATNHDTEGCGVGAVKSEPRARGKGESTNSRNRAECSNGKHNPEAPHNEANCWVKHPEKNPYRNKDRPATDKKQVRHTRIVNNEESDEAGEAFTQEVAEQLSSVFAYKPRIARVQVARTAKTLVVVRKSRPHVVRKSRPQRRSNTVQRSKKVLSSTCDCIFCQTGNRQVCQMGKQMRENRPQEIGDYDFYTKYQRFPSASEQQAMNRKAITNEMLAVAVCIGRAQT